MRTSRIAILICALAAGAWAGSSKKPAKSGPSPLDNYVKEAMSRPGAGAEASPSSLWSPASRLTDLGSDLRARYVDDMVTIVVAESASAVSSGTTKTSRQSNAKASVTALAGVTKAAGPWANLANTSAATSLDASGATSRDTTLTTTLAARVTHVLPNGYLVVEGNKEVQVNSERQMVTVRGVVRPVDVTTDNLVRSTSIAQLEVRIDGKGVVNDAVRRPFILYRLLMGLLPF